MHCTCIYIRTHIHTHEQDGKMDGCAILYKKSRFALVEKHGLYICIYIYTRIHTHEQDGKMDGCAILYKKSRFALVEKHALEFNHVAMSRAKQFKNDKALQCLLKDNVALGKHMCINIYVNKYIR